MLPENHNRRTILYTRNKGAKVTIRQPRQPAGQGYICRIYDVIETSRDRGTGVLIMTQPDDENELLHKAKEEVQEMTKECPVPQAQFPVTRATTLNLARSNLRASNALPEKAVNALRKSIRLTWKADEEAV